MDVSTITGWLLGGFACRLYAAAAALVVADKALEPLQRVAQAVSQATTVIP